ncbi:GTPase-associated protein 1-related protein, partial [Actinocorallia longicatena]|uniref:GTPase-associated protein 1-related protein n=1 Tax=Actinocorallia longicatena TaxID=111803 RepID=UPI0031DCA354
AASPASRAGAAAEAAGAQGVLGDSEILLVEGRLEDEEAAVPLRSRVGREHAEQAYTRALGGADAARTARLARTATRYGVRLDPDALYDRGRAAVGPALLDEPADPLLTALLSEQDGIRAGTLDYLGTLTSDQAVDAFERGLDRVFAAEELRTRPVLRDALLIAAARRGEGDRIEILLQSVTGTDVLPLPLLNALWPDLWTAAEAAETLRRSAVRIPSGWIEPLIVRPAAEPADGLAALLSALTPRRIAGRMAAQSVQRLDALLYVAAKEEFLRSGSEKEKKTAAGLLVKSYDGKARDARDYLVVRLSAAVLTLHPADLCALLVAMPETLRGGYLHALRRVLDPRVETAQSRERAAAVAFVTSEIARQNKIAILAEKIGKVLAGSLPLWSRRDLKKVAGRVKEYGPDQARAFDRWREKHERRGLLSRLVRR